MDLYYGFQVITLERYEDPRSWTVDGSIPPPHVWAVIVRRYMIPLEIFRKEFGIFLMPSAGSVYRSMDHEHSKGRSGGSLHTFPPGSFGAADLTTYDGRPVVAHLEEIIFSLPFTRICVYLDQNFVHVDYANRGSLRTERRQLFRCSGGRSPWILQTLLPGPVIIP